MVAPSSIADISRLLNNIIRLGTIAEVDHAGKRCRVRSGDLLTTWLLWFTARAGDVRTWSPPSVGEQCTLLSPGGDLGAAVVLVGLYSDANTAPSSEPNVTTTHYPDGAVISYDHAVHALTATLPAGGTADITVPGSVVVHSADIKLDAPQTTCTGALLVKGPLVYQSGIAGKAGAGGGPAALIDGEVKATGVMQSDADVVASGISLKDHLHGGVRTGGDDSGGPK